MKKIVIIDHEPYSQRRKDLFCVNNFINEGYLLEIWDVSKYVFGDIHVNGEINEEFVLKVCTYSELEKLFAIQDFKNTIFWVECMNSWKTRSLYYLLSKYRCKTIRVDLYANTNLREPLKCKLNRLFSKLFFKIISGKLYSFIYSLYKKSRSIRDYNCILSSSSLVYRTGKINHPDYERFRKESNNQPILENGYIVFCDTYFPFHPDLKTFYECKNLPDGKRYHNSLKRFFDYIESKYKIPVVIAAHPKAQYLGNEFGERKIIFGHTDNLVINAKAVIQHASNSISYAILKNTPVILITTIEYEQVPHLSQRLKLLGSIVNLPVYNIDTVHFDEIIIQPFSENVREDYIYTYLTSPETKNLNNWEIIKLNVEKLFSFTN